MQIETQNDRSAGNRSALDATREVLAILAESGLVPGQGVEAMLDRFSDEARAR
ncbi:hypothetical protein [Maritimibacter sp. HL-12]|jgi:hypothetical protein|uniref:hypothetical protein n=1 Tax=Maritimibacter sp. HL-12 TaxID=1162418 RepID=UPI000A0F345D|nr:hypothetical protein [Maritimibacter sp. HL-12]SMH47361.1 hypothetical protein SAMN05661107_1843 [Maritimibacter sp. HL-12]